MLNSFIDVLESMNPSLAKFLIKL